MGNTQRKIRSVLENLSALFAPKKYFVDDDHLLVMFLPCVVLFLRWIGLPFLGIKSAHSPPLDDIKVPF